ncbi:DUF2628 domain-containing protein [Alkalihalophilus lindianensis]|uniref:DUF2628 domain-containing protein n=1 Tax=Alkalihalophilus lindianensis TaxID=1630542 RepID=A0ABU3XDK7_9BACI|nr:DUF2628 domain-containing protein [Alkalihalophilus lindianensis]MDV2685970.1 DUF2628 domain-containing protein [Alkalihalophilus lindianensis]
MSEVTVSNEELGQKDDQLAVYVGKKYSSYYEKKWAKIDEKNNQTSWNFAAFFLSLFWLGYRKMYGNVLLIIGIFLVIDLFIFLVADPGNEALMLRLNNSVGLGMAVTTGLFGNYMYRHHARKQIEKITSMDSNREQHEEILRKKGGRSWLGVFYTILIVIGYGLVSTVLFGF